MERNDTANLSELSPRPNTTFAEGEEISSRRSLDVRPTQDETSKVKSLPLRKSKTTDSYRPGRRSLAFFTERFRSSRPQSMMEEDMTTTSESSSGGLFRRKSGEDYKFKYSGRKSSDFTGAYADVARAQAMYMEKLRDEQEKKNIKRNKDGIPIPPPADNRRSSLMQVLGMEKALLAR